MVNERYSGAYVPQECSPTGDQFVRLAVTTGVNRDRMVGKCFYE